jgi:protein-tyrosine phosphatase
MGDDVDLVLDDGRSRFGQPSSVVRVTDSKYEMLREGVVSERNLRRLASFFVLLVCTGNTCRSPMASLLARRLIAERIGCQPEQLEDCGVVVASAGIAAMVGGRASPQAVEVMQQRGLDLGGHETQPLTEQLARHADVILTMTRGHREAILMQWPEAAGRTRLLCADGRDISDPIGGPREEYELCAEQMQAALTAWVAELNWDQNRTDG